MWTGVELVHEVQSHGEEQIDGETAREAQIPVGGTNDEETVREALSDGEMRIPGVEPTTKGNRLARLTSI